MATIDNAAMKKGGFMQQRQKGKYSLRLRIVGGHLTAEQLRVIADVAEEYGAGHIHNTSRQSIEIPFIDVEDAQAVREALQEGGVQPGCCGARVRTVTACQGNAVCRSGSIDTYHVASVLDERYFGRDLPGKFKFGVTGCQNNCLKAEENDLGIKGGARVRWLADACIHCGICERVCSFGAITDDGQAIAVDYARCASCGKCVQKCPVAAWETKPVYNLFFGGLYGNHITRALPLVPPVEGEGQLLAVCDAAIQWFDEHAKAGDRFKFTIEREGWESLAQEVVAAYNESRPEGAPAAQLPQVDELAAAI